VISRFENLMSPIKIRQVELRNRIVMPAISTNYASKEGFVTQRLIDYYQTRAEGGTGLIIVECGSIFYPESRINRNQIGLHDDSLIAGLSDLVNSLHKKGAKVAFQLSHGGKRSTSDITGLQPVSSSSVPIKARTPDWPEGETPRALSVPEIKEIIRAFGAAAARAKQAGADAVEIHGAHSFLVLEFLSPYSNFRNDEYGGTLERRTQFAYEIVREVRRRVDDLPILFRISADEHVTGGLTIENARGIVQILERAGVDVFNVSSGNHDTPEAVIPPAVYPLGFRVHLAREVKQVVNVPVIASGRINNPQLAEEILSNKDADLIAIGRGLICDPEFPNKATKGKTDEIQKCIACNQGCIDRYRTFDQEGNGLMTCVLNPTVGQESRFRISQATRTKTILIIGGGPAGMEAAMVAALRGHKVIIIEKEKALGGQLRLAAIPMFKTEMAHVTSYFERQLERLGVEIRLQTEARYDTVNDIKPDIVILAAGAIPFIPPIEGVHNDNVVTAWDVLRGRDVGGRIVVAGGGIVGCETAEFLVFRGKQVTIIEKNANIAPDLGPIRRSLLRQRLTQCHVTILTSTEIKRIGAGFVVVNDQREIEMDTLVLALGNQPDEKLEAQLAIRLGSSNYSVYKVGDNANAGNLLNAIHSAFHTALKC
jgi:2,4-dienoyl-CoA reductase-like NADH-dependent reductase (Old Yellow Enzyme family)/thioredoxin reductase